jgi:hypothetical protein
MKQLISRLYHRFLVWRFFRHLIHQTSSLLDMPPDIAMMNLTRWRWNLSRSDMEESMKDAISGIFDLTEKFIKTPKPNERLRQNLLR